MKSTFIPTSIGKIHVRIQEVAGTAPLIFLHGVYFDHTMWSHQLERIRDRTLIAIDMPFHGKSKEIILREWSLDDCAQMLMEILQALQIEKVVAIGHSWGSMTILRAANKHPGRFSAVGLCNMPFKEATPSEKRKMRLQHTALIFRNFYMKQAGKLLMGKETLAANPELLKKLIVPMSQLSNSEIKYTDMAVRTDAKDSAHLISALGVPVFSLVGKEDYVGIPPILNTVVVKGGHVSPVEVPEEVSAFIENVLVFLQEHQPAT